MRHVSARLRLLIDQVVEAIGLDGALLIIGVIAIAYGAGLYDPRLSWIVVGLGLLIAFYAVARPVPPRKG